MRRALILGLCAAAASGAAWAQAKPTATPAPAAPPLFDTFKRVCADTGGVYARAIAAPEAAAWKRMSLPIPLPVKGVKLSSKTIRVQSFAGGATRILMAGTGRTRFGDQPNAAFDFCAITGKPADPQAATRQLQAWAGRAPSAVEKGVTSFRWHVAPDGRRTSLGAAKPSEQARALGPGSIVSVDVTQKMGQTILNHTTIRP